MGIFSSMSIGNKGTNTIVVNGQRIEVQGNNISITNGEVKVDGKVVFDDGSITNSTNSTNITISFEGDLANLECDSDVKVYGNVEGNVSSYGSCKCNDIGGNVATDGNLCCGNIKGNVVAGGSIRRG